jgi:hypothetical protein
MKKTAAGRKRRMPMPETACFWRINNDTLRWRQNIDKEAGYENDYPEKWLDGTWEDGIPRVAVKQAHRVSRLKCLGNAIVPQCAEAIFWLSAFDRWRVREARCEHIGAPRAKR